MSNKIITLDDRFYTGEPTVQLLATWGRNSRILREKTSLHKVAAIKSPALEYADQVEPVPGKTIVLIIGLGDHETYGPNRNGDGFPSEPVPGKIKPEEVLTKHYKSYEDGHVFEHHVNDDPAKAIGKVLKAFWNPYMRRVEVIQDFDHEKAPHLLERIMNGDLVASSMGCFCAGTGVLTSKGLKDIEQVQVGDYVLTHKGEYRKVTELHRRHYLGKLYSVKTPQGTSYATTEHPYGVLPKNEVEEWCRSYWRRKKPESIDLNKIQWMPAEGLEAGMYLVTPFNTEEKETLTVDECRLLGYYAAEGYTVNGTSKGLNFTHHKDDAFTTEIEDLVKRLEVSSWTQRPRKNSDVAMDTWVCSETLYNLCLKHVGRLAAEKQLSQELMQQPVEQQKAFLGAYINGDGGSCSNGAFYISTCNKSLAYQLQQMGFRCDLYSRVSTINHKKSTVVLKPTTEYRTDFSRRSASKISDYTDKVAAYTPKSTANAFMVVPGAVISKITDISVLDFDGPVYNFEVEEDNSFVAENHASHNCRIKFDVCSICGNKAPTRKDYCDHLKYEMNRIYPDGRQSCALNPSPKFFDSSFVVRPADRTGYLIKKVAKEHPYELRTASYELGELADKLRKNAECLRKAADIEKLIRGESAASVSNLDDKDARLIERYKKEVLPDKDPNPEGDEESDKLVRLLITYKPSEAISTAEDSGVPLGLRELLKYFLGRIDPEMECPEEVVKSASRHVEPILSMFSDYPRFYDDLMKSAGLDSLGETNTKLANNLQPFTPSNVTQDYMYRKVVPPSLRSNERGLTDTVTYTDPNTGKQYQTNYGTVQKTHDALVEKGLKDKALSTAPYIGGSALLGSAALGMGLSKRFGKLPTLLAAGGSLGMGAMGAKNLADPTPIAGPTVLTDQGEQISGWTEMTPKTGAAMAPELEYTIKRANDGRFDALSKEHLDLLQDAIKTAEIEDELSSFLGPTLDLEKVGNILGISIIEGAY